MTSNVSSDISSDDVSPNKGNPADDNGSTQSNQRFEQHQLLVAEQERANRIKAQDLIQRERKLDDDHHMLEKERKMLEDTRRAIKRRNSFRSAMVLPVLLITAVAAGLFAFQNIEQQKRYLQQVEDAAKNIDALTRIISSTQDEVISTTSKLSTEQFELQRTKTMLSELRETTEQLQFEISQLKGTSVEGAQKKQALSASALSLSEQLQILKEQLEDRYLTNDVNEVYIEYQESDLQQAKKRIRTQQAELDNNRRVIAEKNQVIDQLKESLAQIES